MPSPHVALIVTSADRFAGNAAGYWWEELAAPYFVFRDAGWRTTVASITGGAAPRDPLSETADWTTDATRRFEADAAASAAVMRTPAIDALDPATLDAVFLVGGIAAMLDFPENPTLSRLVSSVDAAGGVVASVCHGAAGLVGPTRADGRPSVAGRTLCSWTDDEERLLKLEELVPFLLETRLRDLGARFEGGPNLTRHVRVHGRLVTGQNPMSSEATALSAIGAAGFARAAA